ncbi:MAG: TonB-dependent receptor, partial [Bacteroidales bacterium]|jgi:iron complex outermembrane receptor protein
MSQYIVSGKVFNQESGKPLPGAHISVKGTYLNEVSDVNGAFSFQGISKGNILISVSYLGFETLEQQVEVTQNMTLDMALEPVSFMSEEVIISAIRATNNSPTTFSTIGKSEISEQNTGKDLPYLLTGMPSTVVSSDAGAGVGYTEIRIRGTDLTGINVTLNGIPVNDGESQGVYFVDLPDLASSVSDIQVQRGVGTSTNGAASFGASINIKTETFHAVPYAEISSAAGSYNTFKNSVGFGTGLINNRWTMDGRVSGITSDGYIDRAKSKLYSGYFSTGFYGKKDVVKAVVMLGQEDTYQAWDGVPKDSLATNRTYNPAGEIYNQAGDFMGYYDNQIDHYNQNYYQLHYAHEFNERVNLVSAAFLTTGKGYYESYKNDRSYSDYGLTDTILGNDTVNSTNLVQQKWLDNKYYGANLALNMHLKRFKINTGAGWSNYEGDHYGKVIWAQVARLGEYDRNWYFNTGSKMEMNVFAKATYDLNEKITLYGDLQFRNIQYEMKGLHDDFRDLTQKHNFNFFNPKAGVFYSLNKKQNLYLSVAVANREPGRSVYRDSDTNQVVLPERLTDFELGYHFRGKNLKIEANVFYMNYKDQLVLTGQINNVGDAIKTNVSKSYRAGIEAVAAVKFLKIVEWSVNGTYSQNKILDFISYTDDWNAWPGQVIDSLGTSDISFSPSVVAGSNLSVLPAKNFKISLISNYVGRQYIDNTQTKSRSLDPYFVNNILINYTVKTKWVKQFDFIVSLNNVFSEEYSSKAWVYTYYDGGTQPEEMNGYFPQAKFNFMAGVTLHF